MSFKSQHSRHKTCSVYKMISLFILSLASFSTCIKCFQLTNSNFVTDIATHFNRLGIIYHLPSMARSDVLIYHKTISKFRYFEINYLICLNATQSTVLQGGCKSKNQGLQILNKYTFPCSKWRITFEKVQNWSLYSFEYAYLKDTFLSFTSKIWAKLRNSIILVFM